MDRAHAPAQALLLAACACLPACGLNQAGVAPPSDIFAYPASAVMDRNGDWLFVTNSNADLRYNDGTLMALSLTRAANDRASPPAGTTDCPLVDYSNPRSDDRHFCCWNQLDDNILDCDERGYSGSDAESYNAAVKNEDLARGNVRIGSFAAGIVLQQAKCPRLAPNLAPDPNDPTPPPVVECDVCKGVTSDNDRLLLGVRGDTSLTFIDVHSVGPDTPPVLDCVSDPNMAGDFATCDDAHRIIQAQTALAAPMPDANPPPVPLPDEPYALAIDDTSGLLYIGHLTGSTARPYSGGFSLFDVAPQISASGDLTLPPPRFIAPFAPPFPANSLGALGVTTMNVHTDPQFGLTESVLASSRYLPEVAGLGTTATCPDNPAREIAAFPNGISFSSPLTGGETRGIEYIEGQDRAFVLQRSPPTLIGFVASTMAPTDFLETCGSPTFLDKYPRQPTPKSPYPMAPVPDPPGTRLFVSCFADGEVYVYDPFVPQLVRTFSVGRGPAGLVFDEKRQVAYVVGFGDNNVSVIDLAPGSRTEYSVTQHIGFPRTAPR